MTSNSDQRSAVDPRPVILIGSLTKGNRGPIPIITFAFIEGLKHKYRFIPHKANRRFGLTRQAQVNAWNLVYYAKHVALWTYAIIRYRPKVAHYPVTSFWNLEKSMTFLNIARWFGVKTVGHLHGGSFVEFWKSLSPPRRNIAYRALLRLDALVVLSEGWKKAILSQVGLPAERVFIVNNPIDKTFEEEALSMELSDARRSILSLGIMGTEKGVFDILKVAPHVLPASDFKLMLIGPDREPGVASRCRQIVRDAGMENKVILRPGVWKEEKIEAFRESSIFLLPSYHENFPLVIFEAAAAGHAIITTAVGATPEFFEDGKSIIFIEPGKVDDLEKALTRLITHPEERLRLGQAARAVFSNCMKRDRIMDSLDAVYRYVLSRDRIS